MSPPIAAAGTSAYWYLTRATGIVTLLLLTVSVVLGVLGSMRYTSPPRWPRFAIETLHRDVSLLVLVVLLAHILTSVLDSFAPIKLTDAVIPFVSSYRPLWLGLGALSFDMLVALVLTSLARRRLGYLAWRTVHWLAYASWPVAVLHGLGTGSDAKAWWSLGLTGACIVAVLIAICVRINQAAIEHGSFRGAVVALTLATPVGLAIFTVAGPLQRGWARRAGTPAALLASSATPIGSPRGVATTSTSTVGSRLRGRFTAQIAGSVTQTAEPSGAIVDLTLRLTGGASGRLRVRLAGAPLPGDGLSLTGSQVVLQADGLPSLMQGQIESLQGQRFLARVHGTDGSALDLHANLKINGRAGTVTGSLSATPTHS
jgi:predicted ferric reductase